MAQCSHDEDFTTHVDGETVMSNEGLVHDLDGVVHAGCGVNCVAHLAEGAFPQRLQQEVVADANGHCGARGVERSGGWAGAGREGGGGRRGEVDAAQVRTYTCKEVEVGGVPSVSWTR